MPDYLDTSAFIKLVRSEPESPALRRELAGRELLSSALLSVEGRRAARRYGDLAVRRTRAALTAITLIPLDQPILDAAADLDATLAHLSEQGIEPEKPPYSVREGGSRIVFVRDPDQYRVEIIEQPGAA